MQDWSKSLPSLSGNPEQAPKAPVQQMLGTPPRGHIQCLGRDGRCFSRAVTSATQQHCQHRLAQGKGAVRTHSCALTLGAGAGSNKKHRNAGAKEYRDNTSADPGDCIFCLRQHHINIRTKVLQAQK